MKRLVVAAAVVSACLITQNSSSRKISSRAQWTEYRVNSRFMPMSPSLRFIANRGQAGPEAGFHVQGAGHTVLFCPDRVEFRRGEDGTERNEIVVRFTSSPGANGLTGESKLPGVAHFYRGSDPEHWVTNVPTYGSVRYSQLYPGIDLVYLGDEGVMESEFHVAPEGKTEDIRLEYSGVKSVKINTNGELVLESSLGNLVEKEPYAYQDINGTRHKIGARYNLFGDRSVGFILESYNPDYPVVIDPELVFLKPIEGLAGGGEWATGVSLDAKGDVIMVGAANRFFPALDQIEGSNHASGLGEDGLVVKLDGTTGEVVYSALFGGTKSDYFNDIVMDTAGNLVMVGRTASADLPLLDPFQDSLAGEDDAFITILDPDGAITFSSYLGGSGRDWGEGVALDAAGNIYLSGMTESFDLPANGYFQDAHAEDTDTDFPRDLFVAKISTSKSLGYLTYLGGTGKEYLGGLDVTGDGEAVIAGSTSSGDFPLANAYQGTFAGGPEFSDLDIFISRVNAQGTGLLYSTYLGGDQADQAMDVTLDDLGIAYIAGSTWSSDFPVVNGDSNPETDISDGILASLDPTGVPLYSLRTNVPGEDAFTGVANEDSTVYAVGNWMDSIRIFLKPDTSLLEPYFTFEAPGHNINAVSLSEGYMAFAGTYWDPEGKSVHTTSRPGVLRTPQQVLSGSQCSVCKVKMDFAIGVDRLGNTTIGLYIRFRHFVEKGLELGTDEFGYVTLNGESIDIYAADLKELRIEGSRSDDVIDLHNMTKDDFGSLRDNSTGVGGIIIDGKEGNDIISGSLQHENTINGGEGDDRLEGGNENDILVGGDGDDTLYGNDGDDMMDGEGGYDANFGGSGNDVIYWDPFDLVVKGGFGNDVYRRGKLNIPLQNKGLQTESNSWTKKGMLKTEEDVVILSDSSGIDTLDFSESEYGITLDLDLQNEPQVIDSNGYQVQLEGVFEAVIGSGQDDEFTVTPLSDTPRFIDGGNGTGDVLQFYALGQAAVDNGGTITTPGYADVYYQNIESVVLNGTTSIGKEQGPDQPVHSDLRIFPNPVLDVAFIQYTVAKETPVEIDIHSLDGKLVRVLVNGTRAPGRYTVRWNGTMRDGSTAGSGTYILRMKAGDQTVTRMILLL